MWPWSFPLYRNTEYLLQLLQKYMKHFKNYFKYGRIMGYFSVAKSCLTLCGPIDCSMPGFPVLETLMSVFKLMSIDLVMPSNHLIFCHPILLLPSIFPRIKVFSNELTLRIRWPAYWNFSFSISSSNEYSGLIAFRIGWFDFLAVQGTLESSPAPQFKSISSSVLSFLYGPTLTFVHDYWKKP